ncbi:type 1 glutamine amidotransferase domain-containing protein [Altererythrobacter aquiaggeris]|uniref:type 1 glutamine amidotransferase domain-containing protein n=1 Tax=Aestuarierythrobacter aquiaggeris TaxID=1898396 RepID=UPI00301A0957
MTRVLIMSTDGFEQSELTVPKANLENAGIATDVASPEEGEIKGWDDKDWGESVKVDLKISNVTVSEYDALLLPGGQMNPDILRMNADAISLIKEFAFSGKPIAAICHAPWLLAEADVIKGRKVTAWPSIRTDLKNAGAEVVDAEVVVDGQFITSRKPEDIPAFSKALLDMLGEHAKKAELQSA